MFGKIFMHGSTGELACSGTVVKDPTRPGRSNLVWTAAHCLHEGKGGQLMTAVVFLPGFDGDATSVASSHRFGVWSGVRSIVSPQWINEGGHLGGPVSQFDFGILQVAPNSGGQSLEEVVGGAVPVRFGLPREQIGRVTVFGYPAAAPFDGNRLTVCDSVLPPTRLSFDVSRPSMLATGCTMTGGSSGGGWIIDNGSPNRGLVSNSSIGPNPAQWLAGPALQDEALELFRYFTLSRTAPPLTASALSPQSPHRRP
ncbi:trypsin-like serine peptidase [Kitasatospora sp. NPDC059827]|uniref:trypsin-like serine peptidase n=1 Tax=Kitasatospora sp. NPDC059827 TaxID=3346964 RepID=UPI00364E6F53